MSKNKTLDLLIPESDDLLSPSSLSLRLSNTIISIVRITHIRKADISWVIADHAHANWEFHYVISGGASVSIMEQTLHVGPGDLYITPPYFTHRQASDEDPLEEYCIECSLILPERLTQEFSGTQIENFLRNSDVVAFMTYPAPLIFQPLFDTLNRHLNTDSAYSPVLVEGTLLLILAEFINSALLYLNQKAGAGRKRWDRSSQAIRIKNFLDASLCKNITTKDIADLLYFSPRQIDRLFFKKFNMSPLQYLHQLRMNTAIHLLETTQMPFRKIAVKCGFTSYQQMLRTLKKSGLPTPSEIRQQAAETQDPSDVPVIG